MRGSGAEPPREFTALVIGNDSYSHWRPLTCCHNDVDLVAELLAGSVPNGEPPIVKKDLTHQQMHAVLEKFLDSAKQFSLHVLFVAGHGVETGQGTFFVPVDIQAPDAMGNVDLSQCLSVEVLKRRFRITNRDGVLIIVLACCRQAVHSSGVAFPPLHQWKRQISRGEIVLYACEPGDTIVDSTSISLTSTGGERGHSTLAISFAKALMLAHYNGWDFRTHFMDVLELASNIADFSNSEASGGFFRKAYPRLENPPAIPRAYKRDGLGFVRDSVLRGTVQEIGDAWKASEHQHDVHPEVRQLWLFTCADNYGDNQKIVSMLKDFLDVRSSQCGCLCWRRTKDRNVAAEVLACAKLLFHLDWMASTEGIDRCNASVSDEIMQRGLGLFLSTDLDLFVQATFLICFGMHLAKRQGRKEEEFAWRHDGWQLMLLASTLHSRCGVVELAHANFLSAMYLRLKVASQNAAQEVYKAATGMFDQDSLPSRRKAERQAFVVRAKYLQGMDVGSDLERLSAQVCSEPAYIRKKISARLADGGLELP